MCHFAYSNLNIHFTFMNTLRAIDHMMFFTINFMLERVQNCFVCQSAVLAALNYTMMLNTQNRILHIIGCHIKLLRSENWITNLRILEHTNIFNFGKCFTDCVFIHRIIYSNLSIRHYISLLIVLQHKFGAPNEDRTRLRLASNPTRNPIWSIIFIGCTSLTLQFSYPIVSRRIEHLRWA